MSKQSVLERYPTYEVTIGIEVHVQLKTKSKIFCGCSNAVVKEPNTTICPVCSGYPGVLPVLNKKVVDYAILTGLATNCKINPVCEFDRKHYFYPDLPKGFQITQNLKPICLGGFVPIRCEDGSIKKIRLIRIHMEEDAGKNIHSDTGESFVDLNRAGTPLLEIVSHPDISSTYEAKSYLQTLHAIIRYINVSTANMEEGAFRADTNISVRKKGEKKLGTRCELKNINSFKYITDATEYEIERQILLLESGEKVVQATRLWDVKQQKTFAMRIKEEATDYRYLPEPDLPILDIGQEWIKRIKVQLPELPYQKAERFISQHGLSQYEADILVSDKQLADYYEQARKITQSKHLVNWILRDMMGLLKEKKISIIVCKITPSRLAELVELLEKGAINNHAAKQVFEAVAETGAAPAQIVKEKGLEQIGSSDELEQIIIELLKNNQKDVERYRAGTTKLFGFFVGQAMKATRGKGNPQVIQELLKKHLNQ